MKYSALVVFVLAALAQGAAIKPKITITGKGAADVGANKLGCAHVKPAGKTAQLVCTSAFTASGFSMSVKDESSKVRTSCVIKGTSGTCGPSGAGAKISSLAKKRTIEEDELEEDEDEQEQDEDEDEQEEDEDEQEEDEDEEDEDAEEA